MKISFVGLGTMGRPMAQNLLKSGEAVTVYDISAASFEAFERSGAVATQDLSVVARGDVICMCLPGSKVVESVVYGEEGILGRLSQGQVVVDFSTVFYSTTMKLSADFALRGVRFLDAPISGMEARAKGGTLTIMCGGERSLYEELRPILSFMGNKILYTGLVGTGQLTKLINQLLFDINMAALAEILPMSVKMGLDPVTVGEVVNSGTGRSYASEFFIPRILKGVFDEGYPMGHAYKDLVSAAELCSAQCIPLPVLGTATATYQMALLRGLEKEAKGAMVKVYEELLGVQFRERPAENDGTKGVAGHGTQG